MGKDPQLLHCRAPGSHVHEAQDSLAKALNMGSIVDYTGFHLKHMHK